MKTLFKKLDVTGVAVMLLAFFVAVGFKAVDDPNLSGWYEVEIEGDSETPADQKIGDPLSGGPVGDCNKLSGEICAVELNIAPGSSLPANMHEADTLSGVSILDESFRNQ